MAPLSFTEHLVKLFIEPSRELRHTFVSICEAVYIYIVYNILNYVYNYEESNQTTRVHMDTSARARNPFYTLGSSRK